MRRLMSIVLAKRFPFRDLVTHTFRLAQIEEAYDLFSLAARRRHEGRPPALMQDGPRHGGVARAVVYLESEVTYP